jgi:hypothetical protein
VTGNDKSLENSLGGAAGGQRGGGETGRRGSGEAVLSRKILLSSETGARRSLSGEVDTIDKFCHLLF